VQPLTGLPLGADPLAHTTLVAKIDNEPRARPQNHLSQADVVVEEIYRDDGMTRFVAMYHSQIPGLIGPLRSGRTSDYEILNMLNRPVFVTSGGNENVLQGLAGVNTVRIDNSLYGAPYFIRDRSRRAPHNLYGDTAQIRTLVPPDAGRPPQLFAYRAPDEAPPAAFSRPVDGVAIAYGNNRNVVYRWDPEKLAWAREQDGTPHVNADGTQVAPNNVLLQYISYSRSPADARSPHAELLGSGEAWLLTDGRVLVGTWTRNASNEVTQFRLSDGTPMELTPGTTWLSLPRVGQAAILE
jgi:hypothetical protein